MQYLPEWFVPRIPRSVRRAIMEAAQCAREGETFANQARRDEADSTFRFQVWRNPELYLPIEPADEWTRYAPGFTSDTVADMKRVVLRFTGGGSAGGGGTNSTGPR